MIIPFGEYLPDLNTFGTNAVTQAVNVEPLANGYRAMPNTVQVTQGAGLSSAPVGAFEARYTPSATPLPTSAIFAGTDTKLYVQYGIASLSLSDVSRGGAYSLNTAASNYDEKWDFVQWGTKVLACGSTAAGGFPIQTYTLGAGGAFADISGAPAARTIGVVRDFVVVGNTYDATDGLRTTRIRWCGFGDETSWAVSAATQADFQDLSDGSGQIRQIIGGDTGFVFCERAIYALDYAGPPVTFRIRKITDAFGIIRQGLAIEYGGVVYFLSQAGFKAVTPDGAIRDIGDQKVDKTALQSATVALDSQSVAVDHLRGLIFFYTGGSLVFVYSPSLNKWATYDFSLSSIASYPYLINTYQGSYRIPGVGVWGPSKVLYRLGGSVINDATVKCRIQTAERQLTPGGRSTTTLIRAMSTGDNTTSANNVMVLTRDSQQASLTATTTLVYNAAQDYYQGNVTAKYHSFMFENSQQNGIYLGLDIVNAKPRGRR